MRITFSRVLFPTFALLTLIGGCAQNAPYHDRPGSEGDCVNDPSSENCIQSYYQEHKDYDLAFVEFSERGNAFNDAYRDEVVKRIAEKASGEGVVLITFIHGWKHSANERDCNLINFKDSLKAVQTMLARRFHDKGLGERRLVGLYIGWRGASIEWEWLQNITFWERKAVAEQVGKGGVTRLLLDLDKVTKNDNKNAMVVVGHSFGGAIVVSAMSEILTDRTINKQDSTIGDGVIVLNPAIEANQALHLVEAAMRGNYLEDQNPLFISLSSDADSATHKAFPAGQTVGLLTTWRQADLERSYYHDRAEPDKKMVLREEHLDATTVGNFAPYLTHRLTAEKKDGKVVFDYRSCHSDREGCKPSGWTTLKGYPTFAPLPASYPLYFIKTDDTVMRGHNDIFNTRVRAFLVGVIDDIVMRKLRRHAGQTELGKALLSSEEEDFEARLSKLNERLERQAKTLSDQLPDERCPLEEF